ncbi:tetratricopeptide repeat protein [Amycolatopsis sp. NPDC004368]
MPAFEAEAFAAFRRGETELVERLSRSELDRAREAGDLPGQVDALCMLARVAVRGGELDRTRELAEAALELARESGDRRLLRSPVHILAAVARLAGNYDTARAGFLESIALRQELGLADLVVWEQLNLGDVELRTGHPERARELFAGVHRHAIEHGFGDLLAYARLAEAALAEGDGDHPQAARLLGQAETGLRARGEVPDPPAALEATALRARLVAVLGPKEFERWYAPAEAS